MTTEEEATRIADAALASQRKIDADRAKMADEIVEGQNIQTVEEGRRFARAWIVTAAQHATNEEYYRVERDKAVHALQLIAGMDGAAGVMADNALREMGVR